MTAARSAGRAPIRVVVAEDDADFRSLLARRLREAGYEVIEVDNGLDAVTRITDEGVAGAHVNLLVMDARMPRLGGVDAARALRERGYGVPCVLMSAFPDRQLERDVAALGGVTLLAKPFDDGAFHLAVIAAHRR